MNTASVFILTVMCKLKTHVNPIVDIKKLIKLRDKL